MNLTLIGTGSGDGWPVPGCPCPSCTSSRSAGVLRGPTAALLDGVLLLDCEPGTPHAAERAGVDLTRVRQALGTRPGTALRWPTSSLGTPQLVAGDRLRLDDHDIRVLEAGGGGLVLDVTGPSGRLLWAPRTGPLPAATLDALRDAELDVVVLDETTGDGPAQHGHLGLDAFAAQVRRLREAGAVTDATDVVAVHLSHDNPPTPELPRRLAAWGARVVDDGASLGPRPDPPTDRRTLVIGGARSGKSREAERLLAAEPEVELRRHRLPRRARRRVGRAREAAPAASTLALVDHRDPRPGGTARDRRRTAARRLPDSVAHPGHGRPRGLGRRHAGPRRRRRLSATRWMPSRPRGVRPGAGWSPSPTRSVRESCPTRRQDGGSATRWVTSTRRWPPAPRTSAGAWRAGWCGCEGRRTPRVRHPHGPSGRGAGARGPTYGCRGDGAGAARRTGARARHRRRAPGSWSASVLRTCSAPPSASRCWRCSLGRSTSTASPTPPTASARGNPLHRRSP